MSDRNLSDAAGVASVGKATLVQASSLVLKAAPGNLHGFNIATQATAGWLMFFDAIAAPADGTVTPRKAIAIGTTASLDVNYDPPMRFNVGITMVFSSTGPFSKTASATAFLAGEVR